MKYKLLLLFFFITLISFSQENCNNGIDDDGDGKIDLNDPDCICNTSSITSIIPNPSFEVNTGCPNSFSQLNLATPWIQATDATSDYLNNCGFLFQGMNLLGINNFPNGNAAAGGYFVSDWNEYLGATLTTPMVAGTSYQLSMNVVGVIITNEVASDIANATTLEPVNVTVYGCNNGSNLPVHTSFSPNTVDPTWIEIGHALYSPVSTWGQITVTFTPSININAIMIGSPPILPPSYPSLSSSSNYPYLVYDNLLLNTSSSFGVNITSTGNFCDNNLVLSAVITATLGTGTSYQWYNNGIAIVGATNSTYNVPAFPSSLGNYSVKITNGTNCYVSTSYIVNNVMPSPTYTTVQPNCVTTTGTITITTPAFEYSFDNGVTWQSSPTKDLLPIGIYYIKIKTPNGCISSAAGVNITQPQLLGNSNITVIQPTTCDGFGTITVNSTIASQYSFDDGATWTTNATATNLIPGTYLVKIKDAAGCQSSSQYITIYRIYLNNPTYTVIQPVCGTGGTINITTAAAEYSFDDGVTWTTNPIANNLAPGYYQIKIKNAAGCESNAQYVSLDTFYLNVIPTYTITQPICGTGGTISITTVAAEYSFDAGTTWTTNPVATNLAPGPYYIMIKNNLGCVSNYQYAYLNNFYLDNPTFTFTQPQCGIGGTITITTLATEYSFDGGTTWTTNPVATNLAAGTYYVLIKNNLGCVSNYQYVNLNYFYLPDPTYIAVNPSCGNIGSITITSPAAQYSFDGGTTWTTNPIANNLPSGYYYIKIKNAQGCESNYLMVYLDSFYLANPNYTVVQPGCGTNGSITITTPASQYSFDGGNTWTTNPVATNLAPGNYYYIVIKNSAGCVSNYQYVYIQPFFLPDPTYTVVQPICGTAGSITITTPSAQYSFDGGTTWTTNPVLSNLTSGTFYIMIKNSAGCVSNYQYVYINQFYLADPTFTVVQPSCGTGGTISIATTSAEYSFDGGVTWTTNSVATNLAAGTYYIAIKNSLGCVSNYQYAYLYQYYLANPTYTVVQPICGNTGIISITTTASEYSFDNGVTWTTNSVASNLAPGTYLIKIRNNLGCVSNYEYISLYQSYLPSPTYTSVQPDCSNGGSITITTIAAQYSFDNGTTWTTNPTATNLPSGYYYIKIKNALGCVSDYQFVSINSAPNVPSAPTVNVVQPSACGATNGSISVTSFANFYSFDNGLTWTTNATLGSLVAGTYLVKIKNGTNGCESPATTVLLNATTGVIAAPLFTAIQPTCTNPFGTITITTSAFQYSFDNGITFSTSNSITNLTSGTYLIKIKNNAGCISTASTVTINSISGLAAPTYSAVQPTCTLSTGTITINTIAAEYSFDDGVTFVTSNTTNNLTVGTYLIRVKNTAGCISANATVSILAAPAIPSAPIVTIAQPSNCTTSTGSITVTSSALLYSFDDGLTWVTNSNSGPLASGTYLIKIKNSVSGCPSLSTTAVINAPPNAPSVPTVTISQPTTCANPFGTIIITSTAFEYSFDNGVTYSNNPMSGLLTVGNYLVKVKNNLNCESLALPVSINAPTDYPLAPSYSIVQPDCHNTQGTITITTLASQFSFDNGLTWSTNATSLLLNPGTYLLKIKNSSGCESNSIAAVLSPFTNFTAAPVVNTPQTFCVQQNATLNSIVISGQNIKWYDALTGGNLLPNTTNLVNGTTYYASQTINTCESLRISVTINIQTTPAPTGTMAQTFCSTQNATLANINTIGLNINWYSTLSATTLLPNSTSLVNGATYYATQTINGCESINRLAITITLINTLNATNYSETICDNLNDGSEIVDLSIYNSDLISNTTNCTFEYYNSLSGAVNQTLSNQITSISNYNLSIGANTIYVRILSNNGCFQIVELSLILVNSPIITIPNTVSLCENHNVVLNAGSGFSSYLWSTGATTSSISVTQAGNYSVTVTQNHGSIICSTTKNIIVTLSNAATITQIETHDWTNNQNTIIVNTSGLGNYEYSLDGIHYQDSNTFTGLFSGIYTVFVRDKNECGIVSEDVFLLMYPPFFTPNNDGYNDTWSVYFSQFEPGLKVEIIDRYGKLLKVLGNTGAWNGTYNGNLMPSDDYWFVVTRANGRTHKGHFAMKR